MNAQTTPSISKMAVLVELKINIIGMKGKDPNATKDANSYLNVDHYAGYYSKCKVARADIIDAVRIRDAAREYRRMMTRPYGEGDWRLLPSQRIIEYDAKIGEFARKFDQAVLDIQRDWPVIVAKQQQRLDKLGGHLFNPKDYPAQDKVIECFRFRPSQMPVPDANHFILDIEQKVLERYKRELDAENERRLQESFKDLLVRLHKPVANMADICTNDKRVFDSLLSNLETQLDILQDLNITGDINFVLMINEVRDKLTGFTPGQIRKSGYLKSKLGSEALQMAKKLEAMIEPVYLSDQDQDQDEDEDQEIYQNVLVA